MTKVFLFILSIVSSAAAQAGNPGNENLLKVNVDESTVTWKGRKVTGEHGGTIAIKEGTLRVKDGILLGGMVTMDMTSIAVVNPDGSSNPRLEDHLKSDDFFGAQSFPTSTMTITNVTSKGNGIFAITADLTIKGITHPVNFDALLKKESKKIIATADLKIDRSLYNVSYRSAKFFENLGDKMIYDEFDLAVKLVAASN